MATQRCKRASFTLATPLSLALATLLWMCTPAWTAGAQADEGPSVAPAPESPPPSDPQSEPSDNLAADPVAEPAVEPPPDPRPRRTPLPPPPPPAPVDAGASDATAQPPATPDPAASVVRETDGPAVAVSLNDTPVFHVRLGRGGASVEERAAASQRALELAAKEATADSVRSLARDSVVIIYAADAPIVQLSVDDAVAAGDASLEVHASRVLASVREAIGKEQRRRELANTVFAISLAVLFSLISVYLLRRMHDLADRGMSFLSASTRAVGAVRFSSVEVLEAGTLRSMLLITLSVVRWIAVVGVIYAWLILVSSLFESTRGYTERLTGFVFNPIVGLMGRVAATVPTFVVVLVAALAVALLVRFLGLYFASVSRGEAHLSWVSPDLAMALSVPVRVAIVLGALIFGSPIVTGEVDGGLTRIGMVVFWILAAACVPLLANLIVGLFIVARRRIRVGERAELGGVRGRVLGMDLWSVRMEHATGAEVHVPHLLMLARPMHVFPLMRRVSIDVTVGPDVEPTRVLALVASAAGEGCDQVTAVVLRISEGQLHCRLSARTSMLQPESMLMLRVRDELAREQIPLIAARSVEEPA